MPFKSSSVTDSFKLFTYYLSLIYFGQFGTWPEHLFLDSGTRCSEEVLGQTNVLFFARNPFLKTFSNAFLLYASHSNISTGPIYLEFSQRWCRPLFKPFEDREEEMGTI